MKRVILGIVFGAGFGLVSAWWCIKTPESFFVIASNKGMLIYVALSAFVFIFLGILVNRWEERGWQRVVATKRSPLMIRTDYLFRGVNPEALKREMVAKALVRHIAGICVATWFIGGLLGILLATFVLPRLLAGLYEVLSPFVWGFGFGGLAGFLLAALGSQRWTIGQALRSLMIPPEMTK
jgi:hypothetical protein